MPDTIRPVENTCDFFSQKPVIVKKFAESHSRRYKILQSCKNYITLQYQQRVNKMEIFPDIHQVDGVNSNCYVVITTDRLTLIDPGLLRNSKKIIAYIKDALGLPPSDIGMIILTHYYMDHTRSAQELKTISGAAVAIHEADARYVMGKQLRPAPEGILVFQSTIGAFYKPRRSTRISCSMTAIPLRA